MCITKSPKVPKVQQPSTTAQDTAAATADNAARQQQAALAGRRALANQQTGELGVPNPPQGGYNL